MSTGADERQRANGCFHCPRCGKRHHPWIRSIKGMWMQLTCAYCDCRFSYKTLTEAEKAKRHAEEMRRYRANHPDRVRETQRRYRETHREQVAEQKRKWQAKNVEKVRESKRAWKRRHPEKVAEQKRRYRERHKDDIKLRRVLRQLEAKEVVA